MATFTCTKVLAAMFQDDVIITLGGNTYALPANTAIGIPDGTSSIETNVATKALCMTQQPKNYKTGMNTISAFFINEIRAVS